jgi:hypothetical protein
MIGEKISPILAEIEYLILEHEALVGEKPCYIDYALRSASRIFSSVLLDKMFELQKLEKIPLNIAEDMAIQAGKEIRQIVKKYTNIDTHELFNTEKK